MKKFITAIATVLAVFSVSSCGKFEVENTATVDLAGNWMCSIYANVDGEWEEYAEAEYVTYNTSANVGTEMWINDNENFWGTLCKVDCNADDLTFGKDGAEYLDEYNEVNQKIWGGKVTKAAVTAPGTPTTCNKIEFFIAFSDDVNDDEEEYITTYYVVGYERTGFPEDDDNFIWDWELPTL